MMSSEQIMKRYPKKADYRAYRFDLPCEDKKVYSTEKEAIEASEARMAEHLGLELAIYQCNVCQSWHLTSVNRS